LLPARLPGCLFDTLSGQLPQLHSYVILTCSKLPHSYYCNILPTLPQLLGSSYSLPSSLHFGEAQMLSKLLRTTSKPVSFAYLPTRRLHSSSYSAIVWHLLKDCMRPQTEFTLSCGALVLVATLILRVKWTWQKRVQDDSCHLQSLCSGSQF